MSAYIFLALAICSEVAATLCLRMASVASRFWWIGVVAGYVFAFTMLSKTLAAGIALGVAYGMWAAVGVALTALLSRILFKETLTWVMVLGLAFIVGGVLLVELGAMH